MFMILMLFIDGSGNLPRGETRYGTNGGTKGGTKGRTRGEGNGLNVFYFSNFQSCEGGEQSKSRIFCWGNQKDVGRIFGIFQIFSNKVYHLVCTIPSKKKAEATKRVDHPFIYLHFSWYEN